MTALKKPQMASVEEFLTSEELSGIKHDYWGGAAPSLEEIHEGVDFA